MKKLRLKILVFVFVSAILFLYAAFGRFITFDAIKQNSVLLSAFVQEHYFLSVAAVASAFFSMAFFLPGAVILTIGCGFLFGSGMGALYATCFLTAGSVLAFLASRHLIGNRIQQRFKCKLACFNREMHRYGRNYLFVLHVVPVLPSFMINYLSGMTEMPVSRFTLVTFLGVLPGSFVYSFAGRQLATMESARDILSVQMLIGIGLLAVLALVPVLIARLKPAPERT